MAALHTTPPQGCARCRAGAGGSGRQLGAPRAMRLWLLLAVLWLDSVLCFLGPACKRSTGLGLPFARRQFRSPTKALRWLDACSSYISVPSVKAQVAVPPKPPPGPFCIEPSHGSERPRTSRQTPQAKLNRELVKRERDPQAILRLVEEHAEDMNAVNCATALHRLSRVALPSLTSDPRFSLLLSRTEETLPEADPRALSTTLHALAHLQHHPGTDFLTVLLHHALPRLSAFTPQALSLTITSLAAFRYVPSPLFLTRFYGAVLSHLHDFTAQGLSTLLHSLATLPLSSPPPPSFLHPALAHFTAALLPASSPTSLSLFASSLSTLDPSHPNATTALLVASLPLLPTFQPQDCVLLLQGLSKLSTGPPPPHLLSPLLTHVESQLHTFPPVALPILLLALVRMRTPLPGPLLLELPKVLLRHHRSLPPRGLVTCLYSLYRHGATPRPPLLESSLAHLQPRVRDLDLQDAAHLLLVLAAGRDQGSVSLSRASAFLADLLGPVEAQLPHSSALDLSTITSSLAKLGHHPGRTFLERVQRAAAAQIADGRMPPCAFAKLLYGLSRFYCVALEEEQEQCEAGGEGGEGASFIKAVYGGLQRMGRERARLTGQDVSHILLALGRMRCSDAAMPPPDDVVAWLVNEVDEKLAARALNHQDLAAIMQGLGMLRGQQQQDKAGVADGDALVTRLVAEVHRQASCFSVREAINVVVGCAPLLLPPTEEKKALLAPIVSRIEQNVSHLKTAELESMVTSLEALGFSDEALRIARHCRDREGKGGRGVEPSSPKGRQR